MLAYLMAYLVSDGFLYLAVHLPTPTLAFETESLVVQVGQECAIYNVNDLELIKFLPPSMCSHGLSLMCICSGAKGSYFS